MSSLAIAIIQADLRWHDAESNRARFAAKIDRIDGTPDLIVLPEMFTTGFTMDAPGQAESMDGASLAWLRDTAKRSKSAVCGSLVITEHERYFNRFILMQPDGQFTHYDKRHLFRLAGEDEHYAAGDQILTCSLMGWKIRPLVCYDLRFPVWSRRGKQHDFDMLLYVANWPSPRHQAWETLLRARAIENQCHVVGLNRVGVDGNDVPYSGGSVIVDYLGNELVNLGDAENQATVTLDLATQRQFRKQFPFDVDADTFTISPDAQDA